MCENQWCSSYWLFVGDNRASHPDDNVREIQWLCRRVEGDICPVESCRHRVLHGASIGGFRRYSGMIVGIGQYLDGQIHRYIICVLGNQ